MTATDLIQPLYIFIASPSDLTEERRIVREIAAELNGPLRKKGWEVALLGWEDRGPSAGRAQADINEDVRRCDIFVGILWERWGTPTGEHSSGFAEEWDIARERHERTGRPDLWLYFKQVDDDVAADGELEAIRSLRKEVEDGELAFYKTFESAPDFEQLLRTRILAEVLDRSGLTRTDLGGPVLDWAAAYHQEPVALLPDGNNRAALADELEKTNPQEAARLLTALADDLQERGFEATAEGFRVRACHVWIDAGDSAAAVGLMRALLQRHVWDLRLEDADMLLRELREVMPPELASELRGWTGCIEAPDDPAGAAEVLAGAIGGEHSFPLDPETTAHWRAVRWRCLLDMNFSQEVVDDEVEIDPRGGGVHLELAFLRADALRAVESHEADKAWADLRMIAVNQAQEHPDRAAWISDRAALDAVAREDLDAAEAGYADAATRWTRVEGGRTNSSLSFFSAQAASQLRRDWSFSGWSWRPLAAAQIGKASGPAARAEELERRGLTQHASEKQAEAIGSLRCAHWLYLRAGLLDGGMRTRSLLAVVYADTGDLARAAVLNCMIGNGSEARRLAGRVEDSVGLVNRMAGSWPTWAAEARFGVLAQVGRCARPPTGNELALAAVVATKTESERISDNTQTSAAEALAALAVAVEDADVLRVVVGRLAELSTEQNYSLAQSGRLGLRMLDDTGLIQASDALIRCFLADDRPDEPGPVWIAEHLSEPAEREQIRQAALSGHRMALLALIEAGLVDDDPEVRELCERTTRGVLTSDLGMTADGKGMHGLMALDIQASIAVASGDSELVQKFGEMLLIYASESRWPMVNRVSAVRGLLKVARSSDDSSWLDALRPIAAPPADHDKEAPDHLRDMWARPGDLESVALAVAARVVRGRVDWLDRAVFEAKFDPRPALREAAWFAAGLDQFWFDVGMARHALRDEVASVRSEALGAWSRRGPELPATEASRLAQDPSINVRLTLVRVLAKSPDAEAIVRLLDDPDAYVRGIAQKKLGNSSDRTVTTSGP